MPKEINILDCTLRDGGYYNNWDFSKNLVNDYLKAISASGIKFVEIGFRSLKENQFNGSTFFSNDNYYENLITRVNILSLNGIIKFSSKHEKSIEITV